MVSNLSQTRQAPTFWHAPQLAGRLHERGNGVAACRHRRTQRRTVIHAAGFYLVGAWLVVQVSSTVLPALNVADAEVIPEDDPVWDQQRKDPRFQALLKDDNTHHTSGAHD